MLDWLHDLQQSFREPVYGFLTMFWPVLAVAVLIGLGWLAGSFWQGAGRGSGDGGGDDFSIADSDGEGGD